MTTTVLLDPAVAFEAVDETSLGRLLAWTADKRVRLGARAWNRLAEDYANDALAAPTSLMKIAHQGVGTLLSRTPIEHDVSGSKAGTSPAYCGLPPSLALLVDDLAGASAADDTIVLGTGRELWDSELTTVSCVPPPPAELVVHLQPNLPTPEERKQKLAQYFEGRRVLIVGGQVETNVVLAMAAELGIPAEKVEWIPSEKNKRARNLKATIGGLPPKAIVVCIVGKVGHDVSGDVEKYSSRDGITLRAPRFASHVVDDLRKLAE